MLRLTRARERSVGLYSSSSHSRPGQHHLDCSLVSLSGIAQALTNLCWRVLQVDSECIRYYSPSLKKFVREFAINVWVPDNNATENLFPNSLDYDRR